MDGNNCVLLATRTSTCVSGPARDQPSAPSSPAPSVPTPASQPRIRNPKQSLLQKMKTAPSEPKDPATFSTPNQKACLQRPLETLQQKGHFFAVNFLGPIRRY